MRTSVVVLVVSLCLTPSAAPGRADGAQHWADVKGQIVWPAGPIPARPLLAVNVDVKHCQSRGPLRSEEKVVNPRNHGLRWVIVWLAPEKGRKLPVHPDLVKIKQKEVKLDQPCCMFEPHVLALRDGQALLAKNSSPVAHNVNVTGRPDINPGVNFLLPAGGSKAVKGLVADRFPIVVKCNIHPWMTGYIRVFDHPYFAVTDEDGTFRIKKAPAGKYRLMIWHETGWLGGAAGRNGREIEIKPDGTTDLGKIEWVEPKE
jgi:hypothetical protein